ncbi:MAG: pilus assembly protein [bacterium]
MLMMSNDHQLYIKAYTDYSDLNGDGLLETTYTNSYDYYGYFDSRKCYTYSDVSGRFIPTKAAGGEYLHQCSGEWSGNFLNWATMTRMDILRKTLYGGYRSTDSKTLTVLERTLLPYDVHSFVKTFSSSEIWKYTPYSEKQISLCNVTPLTSGLSKDADTDSSPPEIRVAKGIWPRWASSEVVQCAWSNGSTNAANAVRPMESTHKLGVSNARVEVCRNGLEEDNCRSYETGKKPTGLLQRHAEGDTPLRFGLMTGSYQKNKSGGVLRKNIERIAGNSESTKNEIDASTGRFINQGPSDDGIINSINRFRISQYHYGNKKYSDCGSSGISNFVDGECSDWGNPLSEMYLENIRYFSGETGATPEFDADDSTYIDSLPRVDWIDPMPVDEWCAGCNTIVISTGLNSFDTDQLGFHLSLDAAAYTDTVGMMEGLSGEYLVGETPFSSNQQCTSKSLSRLSDAKGICPEVPSMEGGYHIAGLAYYARTNDLRPDRHDHQVMNTYSIALAESLPRFEIPVGADAITFLPACQANSSGTADHTSSGWRTCSMTDLTVESISYADGRITSGSLLVNWEDSTWGNDYDMDGIQRLEFCVGSACVPEISAGRLQITTSVQQAYAGHTLRFGYTVTGSTKDGIHLPVLRPGNENFSLLTGNESKLPEGVTSPVTHTLVAGLSTGKSLENPLWYTAKYGGFEEKDSIPGPNLRQEWDVDNDGVPDNFFKATNPADLETSLSRALENVVNTSSSAASVVANSVRLDTNTLIYQARFRSSDWKGEFLAYALKPDGTIEEFPAWEAGAELDGTFDSRNIYTFDPEDAGQGVPFEFSALNDTQKGWLNTAPAGTLDDQGADRVSYLRGDQSLEKSNGGEFRDRQSLLGDIVNSDPAYVGAQRFGYQRLVPEGAQYPAFLEKKKSRTTMIVVGANDGMLHGFDADTGEELWAYVPNAVVQNLPHLADPEYKHRYFVDGAPRTTDVYHEGEWHTLVVGSTGAGGKAVFALDVTDEAFVAADVRWEISDQSAGFDDLGYTVGQPTIIRTHSAAHPWVAVFGNGYESTEHKAVLYIVNAWTGALVKAIDTGAKGKGNESDTNGLSTPVPVDMDGDQVTDRIYAGDLHGNLWRFEMTGESETWDVYHKDSEDNAAPLFKAINAQSEKQPITVRPSVADHPLGGVQILFGTGKLYQKKDIDPEHFEIQSFYGIRDTRLSPYEPITYTSERNEVLQQQVILTEKPAFSDSHVRVSSAYPVNSNQDGWFLDLVSPVNGQEGERVVSNALIRRGKGNDLRVIFNTFIPSADVCDYGGSSWLMEFNALSGATLKYSVFDINEDGAVNDEDYVPHTYVDADGNTVTVFVVSGKKSKVGSIKTPAIVNAGGFEIIIESGVTGDLDTTLGIHPAGSTGRQSWRQLR